MTAALPGPVATREMLVRASRALGKIDLHGHRSVTMVSTDEIEAMALLLACLGVVPTPPGKEPPAILILQPHTEAFDAQ